MLHLSSSGRDGICSVDPYYTCFACLCNEIHRDARRIARRLYFSPTFPLTGTAITPGRDINTAHGYHLTPDSLLTENPAPRFAVAF